MQKEMSECNRNKIDFFIAQKKPTLSGILNIVFIAKLKINAINENQNLQYNDRPDRI